MCFFFLTANKRDMKKKPVVHIQTNNNNNNFNSTTTATSTTTVTTTAPVKSDEPELDTSNFASETTEQEVRNTRFYVCNFIVNFFSVAARELTKL